MRNTRIYTIPDETNSHIDSEIKEIVLSEGVYLLISIPTEINYKLITTLTHVSQTCCQAFYNALLLPPPPPSPAPEGDSDEEFEHSGSSRSSVFFAILDRI